MRRGAGIASAAMGGARRDGSGGFPTAGRRGALAAVGAGESAPPFGPRFVFATGLGTGDNNGA